MTEQQENSEQISVTKIGLKIPPIWKSHIALWVKQCEVAFEVSNIVKDETKFAHLIANIDSETLTHVSDIVLNPPAQDKFLALKNRLISEFQDSESQQIKKLLSEIQLGDKKPTLLLRQMRDLATDKVSEDFLKNIWLQRLPTNIQAILSTSNEKLTQLAELADKIHEINPAYQSNVYATSHSHQQNTDIFSAINALNKQIEDLTKQVGRLSRDQNQKSPGFRARSKSRERNFQDKNKSDICYFHRRFKDEARKCVAPCNFLEKN